MKKCLQCESLMEELVEWIEDCITSNGHYCKDGKYEGYYDSMASSSTMAAGERLVELGLWEKHPDGTGRRWFYRRRKS